MEIKSESLLEYQNILQLEAQKVMDELKIISLLSTVGKPIQVGSSVYGLMVWRDIDITVVCSKLDIKLVAEIASTIILQKGVREISFINDSNEHKADDSYPDGLYIGINYVSTKKEKWNFDIWFVDEPDKQPDLQHLKSIPELFTPETRELILQIKSILIKRNEYKKTVRSNEIYTAVLNDGIRTLKQFEEWLQNKL